MKLYDAVWAPSPRRVRVFLAEKAIAVDRVNVDLRADEQRGDAYRRVNPRGVVPALELDDGEVIDESTAICRYFEALQPKPALFGTNPRDIARIESWTRRIEAEGYAAAVYTLRNTRDAFADRGVPGTGAPTPQIPELAARAAVLWAGFTAMLDAWLVDRPWIATDAFSFADITALVAIDFARAAKLTVPDEAGNIARWYAAVSRRPSAAA